MADVRKLKTRRDEAKMSDTVEARLAKINEELTNLSRRMDSVEVKVARLISWAGTPERDESQNKIFLSR
jgi:hypothetical protein